MERARTLHMFVVYVVLTLHPNAPDFTHPATDAPFSFPFAGPYLREGSPGAAIVEELTPLPSEPILRNLRFGACYGTPLEHMLRVRGIDTVIVAGLYAELGVEMTVRELWNRAFHLVVLSDGCASLSPDSPACGAPPRCFHSSTGNSTPACSSPHNLPLYCG